MFFDIYKINESIEETYYQKNKEVILNRAKYYYENDKERLREEARDKYRNLSKKKNEQRKHERINYHQMPEEIKERLKKYRKKIP